MKTILLLACALCAGCGDENLFKQREKLAYVLGVEDGIAIGVGIKDGTFKNKEEAFAEMHRREEKWFPK